MTSKRKEENLMLNQKVDHLPGLWIGLS